MITKVVIVFNLRVYSHKHKSMCILSNDCAITERWTLVALT